MSDFITIKAASNLFNVPVMTLHWALRNNKIDGVHAGTGGDSKASRLDGVSCIIIWSALQRINGKRAVLARSGQTCGRGSGRDQVVDQSGIR
jgi:hypothetical protein